MAEHGLRKWIITITVIMASLLELIDTTIVNVALPQIMGNLGATLEDAGWLVTGYAVANVIILPMSGWLGDRFGRKIIIWISILGAAPFSLLLPYTNLFWTGVLIAIIGVIIASAFSAILVYAQELVPGKIGMVSGLFFGLAFGMGGLGSALLGYLADHTSVAYVFKICSFLPLLGIITAFLPDLKKRLA